MNCSKRLLLTPLLLAFSPSIASAQTAEAIAEPTTSASESPDARLVRTAEVWLKRRFADAAPVHYAIAWSDLNSDGSNEAIVYVTGPRLCGSGGCSIVVLTRDAGDWRAVMDATVSRPPVTRLTSMSKGWADLGIAVAGGGGRSGVARMAYDGTAYPRNPTLQPIADGADAGKVVLAAGTPLVALGQ